MEKDNGELATVEVAAALISLEDRWLITQRPQGTHLEGLWEFPGGKQDPGETLQDCLAREVEEETGLRIEVGKKERDVIHHYPDKTVHLHFFLCKPIEGEARPLACAAIAWVRSDEMALYPFPPADAELVKDITAGRLNDGGP